MGECMLKEQQEFIDELRHYMLEASNLTSEEAERFAFRVWRHRKHLIWFFEQYEPDHEWKEEKITLEELLNVVNGNTSISVFMEANNILGREPLFSSAANSPVTDYYARCEVSSIETGPAGTLHITLAK